MKKIFLLMVACSTLTTAQTFWNRSEPYWYGLNEIRFGGGDTVYGTLNSGFTRSIDNGTTWTTPVIVNYVQDIALSPNGNIFLAQNQQRMSRSTNKGNSWTIVGTEIVENYCSAVMVSDAGTVFAGTQSGIYRSTNNGDNWTKVAGAAQMGSDTAISAFGTAGGNTLYATTRANNGDLRGFIFRSTDDGMTWIKGASAFTVSPIYKAYVHSNGTVYIRTWSGVHYSSDGGDSWHSLGFTARNIGDIAIAPSGAVYVSINESNVDVDTILYKSTNNGLSWIPIATPTNGYTGIHINAKGDLFVSQDQTYRSTDDGATWKALPILYPDVRGMKERKNGKLYFSTGGTYGSLYQSDDFGVTWRVRKLGNVGTPVVEFLNDTMYVSDTYYQASVKRSTDGGKTFSSAANGLGGFVHQLFATKYSTMLAGTSNGIYRSTNGLDWNKTGNFSCNVALFQAANGTLFGARNIFGGGVLRSVDSGSTWQSVTTGMTNTSVRSLIIAPNGDLYSGTDAGIFRSTNNGDIWVRIDTQKTAKPAGEFLAVNKDGEIFTGGSDDGAGKGVYQSANHGASWTLLPQEISMIDNSASIRQLFCSSDGTLFAGTVSGLFRSTTVTTGVKENKKLQPGNFHLSQNFPNPFNPSTTITFSLHSSAETASLRVYDLLGREVAVLVNEPKTAGTYAVSFDATSLVSGVYLYRLQAGGMRETKKMILMK